MNRSLIFAVVTAILLSGCAGLIKLDDEFTNRPVCTTDRKSAFIISFWKWFGIATEIDKRDTPVVCQVAAAATGCASQPAK